MSMLSVTVLMGGPDAEREISIASATAVADALRCSGRFNVTLQLIDLPTRSDIASIEADVVFPVLHGPFGEGGPLQELLEQAEIPFVGSGSVTSAAAMDKVCSKRVAIDHGIQTPPWCVLTPNTPCTLDPPLVLKPINDGSSVDTVICRDERCVDEARTRLHQTRESLLAESLIIGREITVGIIGDRALPIIEILPPEDINTYDYAAKYLRSDTRYSIEPEIQTHDCMESALAICKAMDIRDIARVDYILDEEGAWFLEVNTMPGFTTHSLVPKAARYAGIEMPELCARLVELAVCRSTLLNT